MTEYIVRYGRFVDGGIFIGSKVDERIFGYAFRFRCLCS